MATYKEPDLKKFPDCSALNLRGRCTRLELPVCQGEACTFKRSMEEDNESLKDAYHRLSSLDVSLQIKIAKKYYGGSMPWSEAKNVKVLGVYERIKSLKKEAIGD